MREQLKQQFRDMLATLGTAEAILDSKSKKKDQEAVEQLLKDMQESAIAIGTAIETEEGMDTNTVKGLEEYCEILWQYYTAEELKERFQLGRQLAGKRSEIGRILEDEMKGYMEVVFLLCKADRWEKMEPVWRVAAEKPEYKCRVLVAPYYEHLSDGTKGVVHDETGMFPEEAAASDYETFDLQGLKPDLVYIDGPWAGSDEAGIVPGYDCEEVKESAGMVIYMPVYEDDNSLVEADCLLPQVECADLVVVPSENIRKFYIKSMKKHEKDLEMVQKICTFDSVNAAGALEKRIKSSGK